MTTERRNELSQGPLLETEQAPLRLSTSADKQTWIDKLVEMTGKHLEQQLLAEWLIKPT